MTFIKIESSSSPYTPPVINTCPVCASPALQDILKRDVPVHQNLRFLNRNSAQSLPQAKLMLVVCQSCGFVFNKAFDLSLLRYGENYDSNQDASTVFNNHFEQLIIYLIQEKRVRGCSILEIGCGKGQFLRALVEDSCLNNTGYGFDPSYRGPETVLSGRLQFSCDYYGPVYEHIPADIVICRHVLGHIPEPIAMLKTLRAALKHSPQAKLYFETPSVDWMFDNNINWDFFYEYCSYYSPASLRTVFELCGFQINQIRNVFGDQYLWIEASIPLEPLTVSKNPDLTTMLGERFSKQVQTVEFEWLERLRIMSKKGKVAIWGGGGKGCTFANLLDPDGKLIDCIIDLNPNKQQGFLPGTGHPIFSLKTAAERGVRFAILLNPNYKDENRELLNRHGIMMTLVE